MRQAESYSDTRRSILAIIYNQRTHGGMEGELECWASEEGEKRENPARHDVNYTP